MRYPVAVTASIVSIAVYFALFWGFDALRILTSPLYGLEDAWRSQPAYWIGRWIGLGPHGLMHVAALFGALKLAVAAVCAIHIGDRIRCCKPGGTAERPDADILELALLLVVALSILTVAPAIWHQDAALIRACTLNLVLASLAAALSALERMDQEAQAVGSREAAVAAEAAAVVEGDAAPAKPASAWFSPWR